MSSSSGSLSGSEHHQQPQEQDKDRPRQLGQGQGQHPNRNQERRLNSNYFNYSRHQQRQPQWKNQPNQRNFKKGIRTNGNNQQKGKYNKMNSHSPNYGGQQGQGPSSSSNQQRRRRDSMRMPPPPPVLSRVVAVGKDQSDLSIEQVTQFLEKVKDDRGKLSEENSKLKTEILDLESLVSALKDQRSKLEEDVKRLERKNRSLTRERDRKQDDERKQQEKENLFTFAMEELRRENTILNGDVKKVTAKLGEVQAELVPMKEQNRVLQQAVRDLFAAISDDDEMTFNFLQTKIYSRRTSIVETQTALQNVGFDFSEIKSFHIEKLPVPGSQSEELFGTPRKGEGQGVYQPGQGQQGQAQAHLGMGMVSPNVQPSITIDNKIFEPPTSDEEGEATDSESPKTPIFGGWSSRNTTLDLAAEMEVDDERDLTTEEENNVSQSSPAKSDDKEKCVEREIIKLS